MTEVHYWISLPCWYSDKEITEPKFTIQQTLALRTEDNPLTVVDRDPLWQLVGKQEMSWAVFFPSSLLPDVPMARERPWRESSSVLNDRVESSIDCACLALLLPTSEIGTLSCYSLIQLAEIHHAPSNSSNVPLILRPYQNSDYVLRPFRGGPSALTPMSWNRVERMNNACD